MKRKDTSQDFEPLGEELSGVIDFAVVAKRKRRKRHGDVGGSLIALSNSSTTDSALAGALIGTLSVPNGVGVYTFSLFFNPGALFTIVGTALEVSASPLVIGQDIIVVQADNGAGDVRQQGFVISVGHLPAGYVPTYELLGF